LLPRVFVDLKHCRRGVAGAGMREGAEVAFHIDGKRLVIEKADKVPKFTHHDLVKALRKSKKSLVDFGVPRGREIL
jgi:hypothetical protein